MNYKMKNIGATVSLYKIAEGLGNEFLKKIGYNLYDLEFLFDHEVECGCEYFKEDMCHYFSPNSESCLICSVRACPLGDLVEKEFKAAANSLESPFDDTGEEIFEVEE